MVDDDKSIQKSRFIFRPSVPIDSISYAQYLERAEQHKVYASLYDSLQVRPPDKGHEANSGFIADVNKTIRQGITPLIIEFGRVAVGKKSVVGDIVDQIDEGVAIDVIPWGQNFRVSDARAGRVIDWKTQNGSNDAKGLYDASVVLVETLEKIIPQKQDLSFRQDAIISESQSIEAASKVILAQVPIQTGARGERGEELGVLRSYDALQYIARGWGTFNKLNYRLFAVGIEAASRVRSIAIANRGKSEDYVDDGRMADLQLIDQQGDDLISQLVQKKLIFLPPELDSIARSPDALAARPNYRSVILTDYVFPYICDRLGIGVTNRIFFMNSSPVSNDLLQASIEKRKKRRVHYPVMELNRHYFPEEPNIIYSREQEGHPQTNL